MIEVGSQGPSAAVVAALREGRLMLQRCRFTGAHVFYPRVATVGMRSGEWDLVPASGLGCVHAATRVDLKGAPESSYLLALIDLQEGPRLMARIVNHAGPPPPAGTKVKMRMATPAWAPHIDHPVPVFELAAYEE